MIGKNYFIFDLGVEFKILFMKRVNDILKNNIQFKFKIDILEYFSIIHNVLSTNKDNKKIETLYKQTEREIETLLEKELKNTELVRMIEYLNYNIFETESFLMNRNYLLIIKRVLMEKIEKKEVDGLENILILIRILEKWLDLSMPWHREQYKNIIFSILTILYKKKEYITKNPFL